MIKDPPTVLLELEMEVDPESESPWRKMATLQCFCKENPMDREPGRLQSMVIESQTQLVTSAQESL